MSQSFVPGYRHDVFISYAHVDDSPPEGVQGPKSGWITTLVRNLRNQLAMQLGRADNHSVWMDYRLTGNDAITPTILDELHQSATLIVFLSQGYLASPWCRREKDTFLTKAKTLSAKGLPIFVVEMDRLDKTEWQAELKEFADLKGYRFWRIDRDSGRSRRLGYPYPDPHADKEYFNLIDDISQDIAAKLGELTRCNENLEPPKPKTSIFLAHVTDDLEDRRNEVRRYLEQRGIRVFPDRYYSNDPAQFCQEMAQDLPGCTLFVQLLSQWMGRRPPGAEKGFGYLQYQRAREKGLPLIQWYDPDLDLETVDNPDQRELLELETVKAMRIEEFKAELLSEIERQIAPPPKVPPADNATLVFVNHDRDDKALAKQVTEVIKRMQLGWALPLGSGRPRERRQDLDRNLLESDAIVWLYGQVPEAWIREQFHHYRKIVGRRKNPPRAIAVCDGPPSNKDELGMNLASLRVINCRTGLNEATFEDFLNSIRAGG